MKASASEPRTVSTPAPSALHPVSDARPIIGAEVWGVLALALILRLPGILTFDLWQDEIYSIYEAKYLYRSPIGPGGMELRPLYFLLLHPLADAWPKATALLRLPSLLFGLAGIVATWLLVRRYAGRPAAFIAALMLTLLPMHINGSQMIRWISLIILLGAMLTHAVIRALDSDEPRHHLLVLVIALSGSLTHVTFLMPQTGLVLGAHLVRDDGTGGFRWPTRRALMYCWLPYLGLLGAYYGILLAFVSSDRLLGDATGGSAGMLLPAVFYHLTPALIAAAAVGAWWLIGTRRTAERRMAAMMGMGLGVPLVVMQFAGMRHLIPVSVLYLSAAIPVFLLAVGASTNLVGVVRRERAAAAVALVLAASLVPGTLSHLLDGSRFEFREPLLVVQQRDPGATVLVYPVIHARWEAPELDAVELRPVLDTAFLGSVRAEHSRFWIVAPLRRAGMMGDTGGAEYRWIQRYCDLQAAYRRPRFDFERYDTELYRCAGTSDAP
jgi:hypothetical protein